MNNYSLAPICVFVYSRLEETQKTMEALSKNYLAKESMLYIFSDGPGSEKDVSKVTQVREYVRTVANFKKITIIESDGNKGLSNSIIEGVTQIIEQYKKVIVVEDDLLSSPNFLNFMNQALHYYQDNPKILAVTGYTMNLRTLKTIRSDYYLSLRASSWGWGTWESKWKDIDWKVKDYYKFKSNYREQLMFMKGGSDMPLMLKRCMQGKIDSWAIRWCYHQFKNDLYVVFPSKSKILNTGCGEQATHTKKMTRFSTVLDNGLKKKFVFDADPKLDQRILKEFRRKNSIFSRLIGKLF